MKYCQSCGHEAAADATLCSNCGASFAAYQQAHNYNSNQQGTYQGQYQQASPAYQPAPVQGRNVIVSVILSILTCNIYLLYWLYKIDEETAQITGVPPKGALLIVFSLITCDLYWIYYFYEFGRDRSPIISGKDNSIIYIVLALLGLSIVNIVLIQSDLNRYLGYKE